MNNLIRWDATIKKNIYYYFINNIFRIVNSLKIFALNGTIKSMDFFYCKHLVYYFNKNAVFEIFFHDYKFENHFYQ